MSQEECVDDEEDAYRPVKRREIEGVCSAHSENGNRYSLRRTGPRLQPVLDGNRFASLQFTNSGHTSKEVCCRHPQDRHQDPCNQLRIQLESMSCIRDLCRHNEGRLIPRRVHEHREQEASSGMGIEPSERS
jgi:hypothetical protein